ncbi:MAG: hypothetical protein GY696_11710, partial [Gammaproteobacteria bacterium]|nr:hypothetical protein [Gammaproteobacteria bacterium]
VQRTIDFDTKLRLDEFRPAQLHREDIQLSLGNGQSLMIQNTRANRFQSGRDVEMAARNWLEILQEGGWVKAAEANLYVDRLALMSTTMTPFVVAQIHDAYWLELAQERSRDISAGIPERLVLQAGGWRQMDQRQQNGSQRSKASVQCFGCKEMGHFKRDCPGAKDKKYTTDKKPNPPQKPQPFSAAPSTGGQ